MNYYRCFLFSAVPSYNGWQVSVRLGQADLVEEAHAGIGSSWHSPTAGRHRWSVARDARTWKQLSSCPRIGISQAAGFLKASEVRRLQFDELGDLAKPILYPFKGQYVMTPKIIGHYSHRAHCPTSDIVPVKTKRDSLERYS
jgi:hypothetical protein